MQRSLKVNVFTLVLMRLANPKESSKMFVSIYQPVVHQLLFDEKEGMWNWLGTASH